jgi:hypothetical protein
MQLRTTLQQVDAPTINMMRRWYSMWERCYLPSGQGYEYYGARGICVCQEWLDFQAFYSFWGDPPFEDATIGRINNDGNYEPGNCEWQTQEQQNNNTRRSRLITWNNKTQSIRDWAFEYNIGTRRLWERVVSRGWTMERALNTPCPQGFATELANRRQRTNELWAIKGQLYQTRSKHRRGLKLSLHLQDLLAVEGASPATPNKWKKISSRQQQQILAARKKGSTIREIADLLNIPKSTVHLFLQKQP